MVTSIVAEVGYAILRGLINYTAGAITVTGYLYGSGLAPLMPAFDAGLEWPTRLITAIYRIEN